MLAGDFLLLLLCNSYAAISSCTWFIEKGLFKGYCFGKWGFSIQFEWVHTEVQLNTGIWPNCYMHCQSQPQLRCLGSFCKQLRGEPTRTLEIETSTDRDRNESRLLISGVNSYSRFWMICVLWMFPILEIIFRNGEHIGWVSWPCCCSFSDGKIWENK